MFKLPACRNIMRKIWHDKISMQPKNNKILRVILVAVAINVIIFCISFLQAFNVPKDATYARDFSAYYIGEWRLFHNPTQVYFGGALPSDYPIYPLVQSFKYTPNFLILFAPFITLSYQNALAAFDLFEVALIPALAFFVYKLVKNKNLAVAAPVTLIVLSDPIYASGYALGNAHVLQTILLVGALYFGFTKKPWLSALLFCFGAFDPRPALLAIPLLLWYNKQGLLKFIAGSALLLTVTNLPFLLYAGIGASFLREIMQVSIVSQWYAYDWLPIFAVAALTVMEIISFLLTKKKIRKTDSESPA
jgi:hypothetical protein